MRTEMLVGLVAGSAIGAAAAVMLTCKSPCVRRAIRRGRKQMNAALHRMHH